MMKNEQVAKPTDGKLRPKMQGRVFVVTKKNAKASNTMVIGIIHLFSHNAKVLINPRSTHSFISNSFATHFDNTPKLLEYELVISTPLGKTMIAELVYKSYVVVIGEQEMLANLVLLDL